LRHVIVLAPGRCVNGYSVRHKALPARLPGSRKISAAIRNRKALAKRACQAIVVSILGIALTSGSVALASTPEELFADGNRLFRDDLYWAALLRYSQAEDAGLNSPLLHYNTGVAHYRAGQHVRARESLLRASETYRLKALSHYNLGLNAWKLGETAEALDWFRKARDQESNRQVSRLAQRAIAELQQEIVDATPVVVQADARGNMREPRPFSDFSLRARVSAGNDSNVFRTPAESYVDLSDPNLPVVDPIVQSGFFIPVSLSAKYSINSFENESFFGAYRFGGRFYQDQNLKNGDEQIHELSFGTEYERRTSERSRKIFSAFTIAKHDENYYDRDNGGAINISGVDITDRMNYVRYGPELWFRQSWNRLSISGRGKAQLWDYESIEVVPEYDHNYFLLGLNAQYRFTQTSLLRVVVDAYRRHFSDRPSFELDGTQPLGTPPVEYDYLDLGVTARQRITRSIWFGLDYIRTTREDGHVGYNNYDKDSYGFELHWRIGQRFDLEASGIYRVYDYENAFAFHEPAAGPKTLERVLGSLIATFDMTRSLSLVGEVRYDDVTSNDARLAYNRIQYVLGIRWEN